MGRLPRRSARLLPVNISRMYPTTNPQVRRFRDFYETPADRFSVLAMSYAQPKRWRRCVLPAGARDDMGTQLRYYGGMSTTETIVKKLFTRDEFQRILDSEILPPDKRFELIRGEIIEMPRTKGRHAGRVNFLTRLFITRVG